MNKKKIVLFGSIIIIILLIVVICIKIVGNKETSNVPDNSNITSGETIKPVELPAIHIEEEKTFETLTFSDIQIIEKSEKENILKATVKNNSLEKLDSKVIDVELFRENGTSIGTVGCLIPDIEAESSTTIEIPIAASVMNTAIVTMKQSGN